MTTVRTGASRNLAAVAPAPCPAAPTRTCLRVWAVVVVAFVLTATTTAHVRITTRLSWARDIAPLVESRCVRCHRTGGRGPMPLTTYEEARPWARAIREEVLARRMPKWHAARGYGDLANDPSLSPFEIAMIVAWVDGGAPKNPPPGSATMTAYSPPRPAAAPDAPAGHSREVTLPCANQRLPHGRLLAIRPHLDRGGSAGMSVLTREGERIVLAWIRDFDPDFEETYRLRVPIAATPDRRLLVEAQGSCRVTVTLE